MPLRARVGVNTGEVVVRTIETGGHTEYTPVGHVPILRRGCRPPRRRVRSRRVRQTQQLSEGYFEFRALGRPR